MCNPEIPLKVSREHTFLNKSKSTKVCANEIKTRHIIFKRKFKVVNFKEK